MVTISRSLMNAMWQATKAATKMRKMAAIMSALAARTRTEMVGVFMSGRPLHGLRLRRFKTDDQIATPREPGGKRRAGGPMAFREREGEQRGHGERGRQHTAVQPATVEQCNRSNEREDREEAEQCL